MAIKLSDCAGCEDNFYNGNNSLGVKRCWDFPKAVMATRYQIGTWTEPDQPGAFTEVRVPKCWRAKGLHHYDKLPDFVKSEDVNMRARS